MPHHNVLKLHSCGVGGKFLNWIVAFLMGRQPLVSVNKVRSDWVAVTSGVPLDTVLGQVHCMA